MLYCSNPICSNPFNPDSHKFCQNCGEPTLTPLFRNRYRVIRLLGEGGFGRTYEATDADRMDAPCVIKQFFPQVQGTLALEKATELFKQEAKQLYELGEHPQIPRLIAYFEQDKRLYLVQELIEGQNLLEELQQQGAFSEEKIRQLLADLLPILKFVHERGVIHRDIKPENIMRRRSSSPPTHLPLRERGYLVLIDFGVSKQATATLMGQVGTTVGTLGYAPVEQLRGLVYPASDLYSLGVTCMRLLTGCLPNKDGSDRLYDGVNACWIWRDRLPSGTAISSQFGEVLDKLIQERVKDRYQDAGQVLQALNAATPSLSQLSATASEPVNTPPPDSLSSAVRVDYTRLRDLLAAANWEEADLETKTVMLQVAGRTSQGWLRKEDLEKFPCTDLRTINDLWVKYSRGRFGFSVQKRIWEEIVKMNPYATFDDFCDRVGWRVNDSIKYENITFILNAPEGHLPACVLARQGFGKFVFSMAMFFNVGINHILVSRLEECDIH
jgi:serine/threonine protein kinase